jgi:hypothetical protein
VAGYLNGVASDEELVVSASVYGMILVERDTVTSGDLRHLVEQFATLHMLRLAACLIKSNSLPYSAVGQGHRSTFLRTTPFSLQSLTAGLARHGADISDATLTGVLAQAEKLLVLLEEAIIARSRDLWHLHADKTSWQVFAPAREAPRLAGGHRRPGRGGSRARQSCKSRRKGRWPR